MNSPIILIVDDEPNSFVVIEALLGMTQYQFRFAASGEEALEIVTVENIDLILLDISMPGMNGLTVCTKIKEILGTECVPIIMVTALSGQLILSKCLELGADDFIAKPICGLELRARVRSMLRIRQQYQKLSAFNLQLETMVQERTEQLHAIIAEDSLTKLPSRHKMLDRLAQELAQNDTKLAVVLLDCDDFQLVNGSFGHEFGDKLLVAIANRLSQLTRPKDTLARLGEDSFCIIVHPTPDANITEIDLRVQEIMTSFNQPFLVGEYEIFITASIGIALSQDSKQTVEGLFQSADTAMYQAKKRGKGSCEVFSPTMHDQIHHRLTLETDLQRALKKQEFTAFYQPIIHLESLEVVGVEALIRWQHPERGIIAPGEFISSLETTGLIEPVGVWIFEQACQQLHAWHQRGWSELTMSINVSPRQFKATHLLADIEEVLNSTRVNPACLKLEITESAIMDNVEQAIALMNNLQDRQIQVSIDDFGTGYSSLKYLNYFPVNNLKIDRSFIHEFTSKDNQYPIVNTIVTLAQELGISIIAEGIETQKQLAWLQNLKCEYGQGYFFAKPLPADDIEAWFQRPVERILGFMGQSREKQH